MAYTFDPTLMEKLIEQNRYGDLFTQFLNRRGGSDTAYDPFYRSFVGDSANRAGNIFQALEAFSPSWSGGGMGHERFQDIFKGNYGNGPQGQSMFDLASRALQNMAMAGTDTIDAFQKGLGGGSESDPEAGMSAIVNILQDLTYGRLSPIQRAMKFNQSYIDQLQNRFQERAQANPNLRFTTWLMDQLGLKQLAGV